MPASVAQLDVHLTGDQDVISLIPTGSGNIVEIDHEMFSTVIHSLLLIQEEQLSVSDNRITECAQVLVSRLETAQ